MEKNTPLSAVSELKCENFQAWSVSQRDFPKAAVRDSSKEVGELRNVLHLFALIGDDWAS